MADKVVSLRLLVETEEGREKIRELSKELDEIANNAEKAGSSVKTTSDDMTKGFDVMGEAASQAGISIQGVGTATKLLKGALTGLIAAGILIALNELAKVAKDVYLNMTTAATSARELKEATDQAALSVIGEITELKRLSGVISDTNEAMYVRIDAIEDARKLMPDHLQGLTNEEILYRGITDELNLSIEALLLKAEIEQNQKQIDEKAVKLLETKQKIDDGALANAKKYQVSLLGRVTLSTMENVQLSKKERQEKELNALLERRNELQRIAAGGDKKKEDPNDPNDLDAITKKVIDDGKKRDENEKEAERKRKQKRREDEAERKADEAEAQRKRERDAAKKKSDLEKVDNALAKERSKRQAEIEDDESREVRMSHEKYDKLIAILEQYNLDTSAVVEAGQAEQDAIEKKYADKRVENGEKTKDELAKIKQEELENDRKVQQAKFDMAQDGIHAIANLLDALSSDDEKNAKKAFENNKKRNIAIALIDTFMGAQKAYNSQMQLTPDSPIRAAIAAAIATTTGLARVAAIKKTKFDDPSATPPETPGTAGIGQESGFQQTGFTALPQGGERRKPDPVKVYVLESDISQTQGDVTKIKTAVRL